MHHADSAALGLRSPTHDINAVTVLLVHAKLMRPFFYMQAQPKIHLPDAKAKALMERIQNAGTEVVEAKV